MLCLSTSGATLTVIDETLDIRVAPVWFYGSGVATCCNDFRTWDIAQTAPIFSPGQPDTDSPRTVHPPPHVLAALLRAYRRHTDLLVRHRNSTRARGDSRQSPDAPPGSFQVGAAMQASKQGQARSTASPSATCWTIHLDGTHMMVLDTLDPLGVEACTRTVAHRACSVASYFVPKLTNQGAAIQPFLQDPDMVHVVRYMEQTEEATESPTFLHTHHPATLQPFENTTAIALTYSRGSGRGGRTHIIPHVDKNNAGRAQTLQATFTETTEYQEEQDEVTHGQEGGLRVLSTATGCWEATPPNTLIEADFNNTMHSVVVPCARRGRIGLVRYRNTDACKGGQLVAMDAAKLHGCKVSYGEARAWVRALVQWHKLPDAERSWQRPTPPNILCTSKGPPEVWWCLCRQCQSLRRAHAERS